MGMSVLSYAQTQELLILLFGYAAVALPVIMIIIGILKPLRYCWPSWAQAPKKKQKLRSMTRAIYDVSVIVTDKEGGGRG